MSKSRLFTARWIAPVTSPAIENGAVLISGETIAAVGPVDQFAALDIERIDLGNAVLLPGLVNVHAHPELAGFRNLLDDLPFHLWIPELMRCRREAGLTDDDLLASALWTCVESMRAGITTMGATESSGQAAQALHATGLRGIVYLECFGPDPAQVDDSLEAWHRRAETIAHWSGDRVGLGISPHAPYSVSDALFAAAARVSREQSLPLATHIAEAEAEDLLVRSGEGPFAAGLRARGIATPPRASSSIALLESLGVLDVRPLLIHCVRIDAADIERIARAGASIAHCPVANARLGHGIAPMVEALEAGVTVAVGTDSVGSNNRLDLLEEARHAQVLQRARLQASAPLPAEQLLRMITIDAARALGLESKIGSLEAGKSADLCAISLDTPEALPLGDLTNAIFHGLRGSHVNFTMAAGRTLVENGTILSMPAGLSQQMLEIGERLRAAREPRWQRTV